MRLDQLDLTEEVRLAGGDLLGQRIAVSGRSALQDVRDEDVRTRHPDAAEELVEELPGLADERDPLLVLVEARSFADEHDVRVRAPGPEDDLRPALCERAAGAPRGVLGMRSKRGGALDGVHRTASLRRPADVPGSP